MPQEHYVLRCFSCETFQVHIVKKAKKWECKMCGVKQSLKRSYGKGSGKDCRAHVMKLNELRVLKGSNFDEVEDDLLNNPSTSDLNNKLEEQETSEKKPFVSKWSDYLESPGEEEEEEEENESTEISITQIFPKEKKRTKRKSQNMNESCSMGKKFKRDSAIVDVPHLASSFEDEFNPSTTEQIKEIIESNKKIEKSNDTLPTSSKSSDKIKHSKYFKYLSEEDLDDNSESFVNCNEKKNIFNADSNDLDDILNF